MLHVLLIVYTFLSIYEISVVEKLKVPMAVELVTFYRLCLPLLKSCTYYLLHKWIC